MSELTGTNFTIEEMRDFLRAGNGRSLSAICNSGVEILKREFLEVNDFESSLFDVLVHLINANVDPMQAMEVLTKAGRTTGRGLTIAKFLEIKQKASGFIQSYQQLEKEQDPSLTQYEKVMVSVTNVGLDELVRSSLRAIVEKNSKNPSIFVRSGELVRILPDEFKRPRISKIDENAMLGILCRSVEYIKCLNNGMYEKKYPPNNVIKALLGYGIWEGLPTLKGISHTPIIHSDGSINLEPGYDSETEYYYEPGNMGSIPLISETPTSDQVKEALSLFLEPFCEFPFEDNASYAAILAAVLSVMGRNLIKGSVPLLIISKPQMGTGASKICEIISSITTGRPMCVFPQSESDAELRKAILAIIQGAPSLIILDNYEGAISSPIFASLITSQEWSDRVLCQTRVVTYPNKAVWIANGNNLKIGKDFPRRVYWSRLDAQESNPWEREGFTHPDIISWVLENRGRIVGSILTILHSYLISGSPGWNRPDKVKIMGGFESWCDFIGGILDHAGVSGFLENQEKMYDCIDIDTSTWDAFVSTWYDIYKEDPVSVSEICTLLDRENTDNASENSLLSVVPESVGDVSLRSQSFKSKLGRGIARNENRVFPSGYMLKKVGVKRRASKWQVIYTNNQTKLIGDDSSSNLGRSPGKQQISSRNRNHLILKNPGCTHSPSEGLNFVRST